MRQVLVDEHRGGDRDAILRLAVTVERAGGAGDEHRSGE